MDRKLSNKFRKPELLAPGGDLKRAKTAILYGADAVYLGGQSYSLRSRASNFTIEDIRSICAFARKHNAHVHVTVNIIPHNEDFEGLKEYLMTLEDAGVTAIIVSSPTIMELARKYVPKLELHCSTQMSVTNSQAIQFLYDHLHIDRSVLARECSMEDIISITEKSPVDTEAFIHGGMCVNYSGRCTLSNRMTLRDANRGGCAQSCRWSYRVFEDDKDISENQVYTMGSRDLMASSYLYDLMNAGVASLKIEGRMKTEYYVASIVSAYRHLIDEIYEEKSPLSKERMAYHNARIMRGENREVCTGFYSGEAGLSSLIYHENSNASVNHDFFGTVVSSDDNEAVIEVRNVFKQGDSAEVLSPYCDLFSFEMDDMKDDEGNTITLANHPMQKVTVHVPCKLHQGDIIRRAL